MDTYFENLSGLSIAELLVLRENISKVKTKNMSSQSEKCKVSMWFCQNAVQFRQEVSFDWHKTANYSLQFCTGHLEKSMKLHSEKKVQNCHWGATLLKSTNMYIKVARRFDPNGLKTLKYV